MQFEIQTRHYKALEHFHVTGFYVNHVNGRRVTSAALSARFSYKRSVPMDTATAEFKAFRYVEKQLAKRQGVAQ